MTADRIRSYTREVLSFRLGSDVPETAIAVPSDANVDRDRFVQRSLRILQHSKADTLVFFGLGSGQTMNALARTAPANIRLLACELSLEHARATLPAVDRRWEILADSSPWAHFCLLGLEKITAENSCLTLNPELPAGETRNELQALQRLLAQAKARTLPRSMETPAPISAGAILSPHEPGLDAYFSQFPAWLEELCIVWDSDQVPDMNINCACPVRQTAHPLDDFASQRNRMREMCSGEWMLYLDGDECFTPEDWRAIPGLVRTDEVDSYYFTRQTLYPDESHAKVGFGLWPDLQQRLFRNMEGVSFERPIHERLTGLSGSAAIALDLPIRHYSRLRKSPAQIREKLARFDEAAAREAMHRLSEDYPSLSCSALQAAGNKDFVKTIVLPASPG